MIPGIDRERSCLHGLAAIHVGIRLRVDPVPARREGCRHLIRQRTRCDDGGDRARFIRHDSELSRLAAFCRAGHFALLKIRLRIAFDKVHPDGRADRGRVRRHGNRTRVGINLSLVLRFDGDGFIRLQRAVLHMRVCLIVHPVQADLPRAGESRRVGTARRDVQDFRVIVCTDGERFIDGLPVLVFFFIAAQGEIRPIHIGFIVCRDGVVHETPRERLVRPRISRLELEIQRQRSRNRLDVTVIPSLHAKGICRNRGRSPAFLFRHGRLRRIHDAIHRHIGCGCQTTLRLSHIVLHRAILIRDIFYMLIRLMTEERRIFIGIIHVIDKIIQLDAVFIAVFDRMETGAAGLVLHIRALIVISDCARDRGCDDLARVLRGDIDIVICCDMTRDRGFRIAVDVIVRNGRTDPCAAADADRARRLDGLRQIFRGGGDILRRDRRLPDARLRRIVETVHAHRRIDSDRLRRAACRGHRDIERACLRTDICRSLRRDHRAVIDISLCVVFLMDRKRRAADTFRRRLIHAPSRFIENILESHLVFFIFISGFPKIQRSCAQVRLDRACQVHRRDVRLARDIHIPSGIDCRRRRLRVIFLANIRFGVVVIVHDGDGRRAIHVIPISCRLRPAVHEVRKDGIRIDRGKEYIQKLVHGIGALPARLPGDLRLRMDGRIPDGLRVATDESGRVISLLQIRNRRRDRIVLLRGLILGDRCIILVRTNDRMAARERQRIDRERLCAHRVAPISRRVDTAHLPRHRRRRVIGTEKERRRRIRPQLVPWFLLVRRFRLFVRRIKVKVLCRLPRLVFFRKCFFQLREKTPKASQNRIRRRLERRIPADARCRHRIRRIDAAVFRERILRLHRHIALRVDRARHIRGRFRIRNPEPDREPQRLPAVRRARAQRADRFRTDVHISLACQRRLLAYLRCDVARKLCPGEIQRHPAQRHDTEIYQAHLDRIRAFRVERRILRGRDRAVVHIDIRLHVADAHVKPDTDQIHIERRDIRLCVRRDLHIAMLRCPRAIAESRDVRLVDVHIRLGIRLRRRAERAEIAAVLFDEAQDGIVIFFPLDACLDLRIRKLIVIADDARRRGAGGNVYVVTLDDISSAAILILSHLHQRIRAVADVPCIELRRRCRMDGDIARLVTTLPLGRDRRIIHIDARDAHDISDRCDVDLAAVLLFRRRVDVRILDGNHAIARLLTGIRLQLRITRRSRQRDRPAAGRDAARLCFRAFDGEIIPRLYGDTPPMRHGLARQRDILLRDQRDAVRRRYRRRRIHDARRIYQRRTIHIRRLILRIGMKYGTRLDHAVRLRDRTLCRSNDHAVLCIDFARERDPCIACRVAAPQRAVIQKPRPLRR